jgi:hypothetical protein
MHRRGSWIVGSLVLGLGLGGCIFPMGQPSSPPPGSGYSSPPPGYNQYSGGGYQQTSSGYQQTSGGYEQTSAGYQGTSSGGGNEYFSVTLHNSCSQTVKLFIGDGEPPFGSGTYTSIGSNTIQSQSGSLPEAIWIIDDSQRPISAYTPRPGSQDIEIISSCTGFAPY